MEPKFILLEKVDEKEFSKLYQMLESITIPLKQAKCLGRSAFTAKHRACAFGLAYHFTKQKTNLSLMSRKHPEIHEELMRIGHLICDPANHSFTSIYLNRNNVCAPHKDKSNHGDLVIVSFGKYKGCTLMIEGENANAYLQPIKFDGTIHEHWNTDDLEGIKYSLVFYTHSKIVKPNKRSNEI
jgi:hypothetical protein